MLLPSCNLLRSPRSAHVSIVQPCITLPLSVSSPTPICQYTPATQCAGILVEAEELLTRMAWFVAQGALPMMRACLDLVYWIALSSSEHTQHLLGLPG